MKKNIDNLTKAAPKKILKKKYFNYKNLLLSQAMRGGVRHYVDKTINAGFYIAAWALS